MKFKKIYVEITNKCNLNCSFCSKLKRQLKTMSKDEFKHVISEIKPYTDYIYLHLKGEPLIHPDLEDILKIAKENNIIVNITTNGTKLSDTLDIIKNCGCLRQVNISLQAMEQVKDKDSYLKNVMKLIQISKEKNFFVSLRIWVNNVDVNNYIKEFFGNNLIEEYKNVFWSYDEEFKWPTLDDEVVSKYGTCLGTRTHVGVLVNGDVVPCCLDGNGCIVLGNIFKEKFEDILKSSRFTKMRDGLLKNILKEELCQKCTYRRK